jgi:hypothetical protein
VGHLPRAHSRAGLVVNAVLRTASAARDPERGSVRRVQRFTPAFVMADAQPTAPSPRGQRWGSLLPLALALGGGGRRSQRRLWRLVSSHRLVRTFSDTVVSFFVMWITADALLLCWCESRASEDCVASRAPSCRAHGRGPVELAERLSARISTRGSRFSSALCWVCNASASQAASGFPSGVRRRRLAAYLRPGSASSWCSSCCGSPLDDQTFGVLLGRQRATYFISKYDVAIDKSMILNAIHGFDGGGPAALRPWSLRTPPVCRR